jgi:hypothetical protein
MNKQHTQTDTQKTSRSQTSKCPSIFPITQVSIHKGHSTSDAKYKIPSRLHMLSVIVSLRWHRNSQVFLDRSSSLHYCHSNMFVRKRRKSSPWLIFFMLRSDISSEKLARTAETHKGYRVDRAVRNKREGLENRKPAIKKNRSKNPLLC